MANVKPVYSVAEAARMMGLSNDQARRRLIKEGVIESQGRGKKQDVLLSRLKAKMPDYWGAMIDAAQLER